MDVCVRGHPCAKLGSAAVHAFVQPASPDDTAHTRRNMLAQTCERLWLVPARLGVTEYCTRVPRVTHQHSVSTAAVQPAKFEMWALSTLPRSTGRSPLIPIVARGQAPARGAWSLILRANRRVTARALESAPRARFDPNKIVANCLSSWSRPEPSLYQQCWASHGSSGGIPVWLARDPGRNLQSLLM